MYIRPYVKSAEKFVKNWQTYKKDCLTQSEAVLWLFSASNNFIREYRSIDQVSRIYLQGIGNVKEYFQRKRTGDARRFNRADVRPTNIRSFCLLLLGESSHLAKRRNSYTQLDKSISIFELCLLAHAHHLPLWILYFFHVESAVFTQKHLTDI